MLNCIPVAISNSGNNVLNRYRTQPSEARKRTEWSHLKTGDAVFLVAHLSWCCVLWYLSLSVGSMPALGKEMKAGKAGGLERLSPLFKGNFLDVRSFTTILFLILIRKVSFLLYFLCSRACSQAFPLPLPLPLWMPPRGVRGRFCWKVYLSLGTERMRLCSSIARLAGDQKGTRLC